MNCPIPVIETKKFLEGKDIKRIEVCLDNPISAENVQRFLVSQGFATKMNHEGETYRIEGMLDEKTRLSSSTSKKLLVYIDGETMGRGNEELGEVLMGAFLKTLKELEPKPWRLVLINTGVKLISRESGYIDILKEIEDLGVEIISCGTCLDYFNLKGKIGVGRISNMFEILSSFNEATNVIRP